MEWRHNVPLPSDLLDDFIVICGVYCAEMALLCSLADGDVAEC